MPKPSFFRPLTAEFTEIDPSIRQTLATIQADDNVRSRGMLFEPGSHRPKSVVVLSHPSADLLQHWVTPHFVEAGFAVFNYSTRNVNNYSTCVHENLVLDVGAVVRYLRDGGFENVILLGKSGGASLFAYYQAEADAAPGSRVAASPGGGGPNLNDHELSPADAMIFLAGHPGQGRYLQGVIDASVVDETNPWATDPSLDMYDPRNGWREPPAESRYDRGWLAEYREAQAQRVRRIDMVARTALEDAAFAHALAKDATASLSPEQRRMLERRGLHEQVIVVYRTEANPTYTDLSIDPSERAYGSIQGTRPDIHNYALVGFGRIVTPEAWLSTWSGTTSYANLERNLPRISQPSFFVFPQADQDIYPAQFEEQVKLSGATDKEYEWISGMDHALLPGGTKPHPDTVALRAELMRILIDWTSGRFEA